MQMPEELAQNDVRVLAHQPQIPQIVLLREGGVPVWQTRRLSLVGAGRNVTDDVNLCAPLRWIWVRDVLALGWRSLAERLVSKGG